MCFWNRQFLFMKELINFGTTPSSDVLVNKAWVYSQVATGCGREMTLFTDLRHLLAHAMASSLHPLAVSLASPSHSTLSYGVQDSRTNSEAP